MYIKGRTCQCDSGNKRMMLLYQTVSNLLHVDGHIGYILVESTDYKKFKMSLCFFFSNRGR